MLEHSIYDDIAARTGGDIYIGVVGPVRTGKSTFIKRFMDTLVVPNISSPYDRERANDELPQSAAGKTVMTTEPKFIPDEAVEIAVGSGARMRVKMIDCVGYIVPEALGQSENGEPRMVMTPWSEQPMPFAQAAETGTHKVICDHSTIGIVVTTDGTIGEIPRESYVEAEKRVIGELKELGKPFVVVLNSADTGREESIRLAYELEDSYGVPVALVNCLELNGEDIRSILEMVLTEFPVVQIGVQLPGWTGVLGEDHWLSESLRESILQAAENIRCVGDIAAAADALRENEFLSDVRTRSLDLGTGCAELELCFDEGMFYRIISELSGFAIEDEEGLIRLLCDLAEMKKQYDKVSGALRDVRDRGYGIVMPGIEDLKLEEPEIVRQSAGYGVRLKASAPSIHMISAEIQTEINPVVGTEEQSEELVQSMLREFEESPESLWETNIFGRTLHELVTDGLHSKLAHMPDDARAKLGETLQRIINEGSGGLICILL